MRGAGYGDLRGASRSRSKAKAATRSAIDIVTEDDDVGMGLPSPVCWVMGEFERS